MVYDVTSPSSFEHLANWKSHFMSRSQPEDPDSLPFLVLGNKDDNVIMLLYLAKEGKVLFKNDNNF